MSAISSVNPSLHSLRSIESLLLPRLGKSGVNGTDSDGKEYKTLIDLWKFIFPSISVEDKLVLDSNVSSNEWYTQANEYWESEENCPINDDGVLGGFGALTPMDTRDSNIFLSSLKQQLPLLEFNHAADCGAGIGRVTKNLLLSIFQKVDMIEQSQRLLQSAPSYLGIAKESGRVNLIHVGLQDFVPSGPIYDVIWIQWVIGHLHDLDFIEFFQRCARGLTENGVIILKDNVITSKSETFNLDLSDYSVARNIVYMELLFELAGMEIIMKKQQTDFPKELIPVMMYALRLKKH